MTNKLYDATWALRSCDRFRSIVHITLQLTMSGTFHSPNGSPGLPPRLRVPPTPPYIHRKLQLSYDKQGLTLFPEEGDGLRLRWGPAGVLEKAEQRPERYVSIAGVLGVVKLWDCESTLTELM